MRLVRIDTTDRPLPIGEDLDTYAEFAMSVIRRLPGIKAMQTTFTLKEVKPPTVWPIPQPR